MPKPRSIDNTFWDDPDIATLKRDERLLLIGMITSCADDEGRLLAEPGYLRKRIFGYDDDVSKQDVREWRDNIVANCRNVNFYVHDGQDYIWFSNWCKHQKIRYVIASKLPEPPNYPGPCGEITAEQDVDVEDFRNLPQNSVNFPSVGLSSVALSSDHPKSSPAQIRQVGSQTRQPKRSMSNKPMLVYLLQKAGTLMSRGELVVAQELLLNDWFNAHEQTVTEEIINRGIKAAATYTEGDSLKYLLKVMDNEISNPNRKKPTNGKGANGGPDLTGPVPPAGYAWEKDIGGKWKLMARDDTTGLYPYGCTDMVEALNINEDRKQEYIRKRESRGVQGAGA